MEFTDISTVPYICGGLTVVFVIAIWLLVRSLRVSDPVESYLPTTDPTVGPTERNTIHSNHGPNTKAALRRKLRAIKGRHHGGGDDD